MKVRILSGSQAGAVVEMPATEAECAVATGYAERFVPAPDPEPEAEEPKKKAPKGKEDGK
jgi:hypothetical protein